MELWKEKNKEDIDYYFYRIIDFIKDKDILFNVDINIMYTDFITFLYNNSDTSF